MRILGVIPFFKAQNNTYKLNLNLEKGDYPQNSHVGFSPNK